jgi:hypothetical protein
MIDILIFFLWFSLWTGALIGIGAGIFRLLKINPIFEHKIFESGVIGFVALILIAGIINFFSAIWWVPSLIIMFGGLMGFLKIYPFKNLFHSNLLKYYITLILIFGSILIWFKSVHDTGGYHLVAINWIATQAIPFGIANLYSRLGFNTTWFLTNACIDQLVFLFHRPLFITNGILLFLYFSSIIRIIEKGFLESKKISDGYFEKVKEFINSLPIGDLFLILSIYPVIDVARGFISTTSPDMPVFLFEIMTISISLNIICHKYDRDIHVHALFLLGLMGILIITIKPSALPIFILICGIYILEIYKIRGSRFETLVHLLSSRKKVVYLWGGVIVTLVGIFLTRGFILSGNPFFPIPLPIQLTFPWSVPKIISTYALQGVINSALLYGSDDQSLLIGTNWFGHWIIEFLKHTKSLVFIWTAAIGGLFISCYHQRKHKIQSDTDSSINGYFILIWLICALIFWFYSAPDPRFGFGFLFSLPLFLLMFPVVHSKEPYPKWFTTYISQVFLIFLTLSVVLIVGVILTEGVNIPKMPDYSYTIEHSQNGDEIYFSHSWDQNWDMPLPNTPETWFRDVIVEKRAGDNRYLFFWNKI